MPRATGPSPATDPRGAAQAQQDLAMAGLGDFDLPRTTVTRLAKSQVGDSAKLSADVISALIKSSTVFINYLAAAAHEHAEDNNRKTIAYQDIFQALGMIQYGGSDEGVKRMEKVLTGEIDAWDAIQKQAKAKPAGESSRGKHFLKTKAANGTANNDNDDEGNENENENEDEEEEEEEEMEQEDDTIIVQPTRGTKGKGKGKAGAGEVDMDVEVEVEVEGAAVARGSDDGDEEPMEGSDQGSAEREVASETRDQARSAGGTSGLAEGDDVDMRSDED